MKLKTIMKGGSYTYRNHGLYGFYEDQFIRKFSNTEADLKKCVAYKKAFTQLTFTCSTSTIETLENVVFIVNFEHILHHLPVFLLLSLNR